MRRAITWAGFALLLAGMPAVRADDKDAAKKEKTEKAEPKEKLVPVAEIVGRLGRVEGAQKNLVVHVPQTFVVPAGWGRWQVQTIQREVELQAADDLKIRVLQPPPDFDEKGRPKRYTKKELDELRGPDKKLPGYQADFDSLKPEQIVRVTVVRKKGVPQAPAPRPRKKDKDNDPPEPDRPLVSLIVILSEPAR